MDEVRREAVIRRVLAGKLAVADAALVLGISERQVWRLRARFVSGGSAALAHGTRGRAPANQIAPALAVRVVAFAQDGYVGINDSHWPSSCRARGPRALAQERAADPAPAGLPSPRRHRASKYRSRRERRPAAGMLVQLDGSRHRWFGRALPYAVLLGAIDDATGECMLAAVSKLGWLVVGWPCVVPKRMVARASSDSIVEPSAEAHSRFGHENPDVTLHSIALKVESPTT